MTDVREARGALMVRRLAVVFTLVLAAGERPPIHAQPASDPPFFMHDLGSGVWAAITNPDARPGSVANAGFVIGDDGVVVIDTAPNAGKALLAEIRQRTKLPIRFVVNTHYHPDHVANNGVFTEAGAMVVAHRHVRGWIHTESLKFFGEKITPQQKAEVEAVPAPNVVYDNGIDLYIGKRAVLVRSFPGHTGGDSVVLIPDARIAFLGDLFWHTSLPNTMDATIRDWIETLNRLLADYGNYAFVSGHGAVGTASDVAAFRDYMATLMKTVSEARSSGLSGDALTKAVLPSLAGKYSQWGAFKGFGPRSILDAEAELGGTKKNPQPVRR
jgi:glyoxylase-like metal-dependent hydrolase (beta-lactamase superfamily II)